MNEHYNMPAAVKKLERLVELHSSIAGDKQLSDFKVDKNQVSVVALTEPKSWRLVKDSEEMILRFQGILCGKDLPPIDTTVSKRSTKYLRQCIAVTGLGTPVFEDNVDVIRNIHTLFSRHFEEDKLLEWSPTPFQNMVSIDVSNRYFTSRRDCPNATSIKLHSAIDPTGRIKSFVSNDFIHTEDNEVKYYYMSPSSGRMEEASPATYRVGDLVEVQTSFVVFPVKEGKFKMSLILRSIASLDHSETDTALHFASKMTSTQILLPVVSLKRKAGYDDKEDAAVASARKKFQNMSIEKDDN